MDILGWLKGLFQPKQQTFASPLADNYLAPSSRIVGSTAQSPNISVPGYGAAYADPKGNLYQSSYKPPAQPAPGGTKGGQYFGGGSGQGSLEPANAIISNSMDKLLADYKARGAEFDAKNPFALDDILSQKRKEVAARLDPYYTKTLEDYLRGVEVKRTRSIEDENQVKADINADVNTYTGRAKDVMEEAVRASGEGFADSNLFFSGAKMRTEGLKTVDTANQVSDYLTGSQRKLRDVGLQAGRGRFDLGTAASKYRTDIGQEKYYQTESQAQQESRLAQARRELERNQYIGAPFSSGGLSSISQNFSSYL